MRLLPILAILAPAAGAADPQLEQARDRQDRAALERLIGERTRRAQKNPGDAEAHYALALAGSYLAQVAIETGDRALARSAAESAVRAAERAVALQPDRAEHHRVHGTLCGQVIPGNVLAGLRYGRCALEALNKAIELAPRSAEVWLSRGVGYYYLPAAFGGGVEPALRDFEQALRLNARSAEAHLWMGVALRKANRPAEARQAFQKALALNPNRIWAKQQLEKTPAQ